MSDLKDIKEYELEQTRAALLNLRAELARVKDENARMDEALKVARDQVASMESIFSKGMHFDLDDDFIGDEGCSEIASNLKHAITVIDEARGEK